MWMDYKEYPSFFDTEFYNGYMYLCDNVMNIIFRMDVESKEVEFIGRFSNEMLDSLLLCRKVKKYKDKVFFFPGNAESIAIYDTVSGKMKCVKIKKRIPDPRFLKVIGYIEREKSIVLVPALLKNSLIECDMLTGVVVEHEDWFDSFFTGVSLGDEVKAEFISQCIDMGDVNLFRLGFSNYWLRKDWRNKSSELLILETPPKSLMFNGFHKTKIYGIERGEKKLIEYSDLEREIREVQYKLVELDVNPSGWQMIIEGDNRIFLLDRSECALFEYIPDNNEMKLFVRIEKDNVEFKDYREKWPAYCGYKIYDHCIYLFPYGSSRMVVIRLLDATVNYIDIRIQEQELKRINTELIFRIGQVAKEETRDSLTTLLRYVTTI